jgi:Ala-tRNA(Pro) deacylase
MTADTAASADPRSIEGLPTTPAQVLALLDDLGVAHRTVEHAPVFTVEQAQALRGEIAGHHVKNLFLRDRKEAMWLVTTLEDRAVDLKKLGERLGGVRLSFGSPERLMRALGVRPGSVTPLALVNDRERQVQFHVDRALLDGTPVNAHPLVNWMTSTLPPGGLQRFLAHTGHEAHPLDFPL